MPLSRSRDRGQATVEYALILAIAIAGALAASTALLKELDSSYSQTAKLVALPTP